MLCYLSLERKKIEHPLGMSCVYKTPRMFGTRGGVEKDVFFSPVGCLMITKSTKGMNYTRTSDGDMTQWILLTHLLR